MRRTAHFLGLVSLATVTACAAMSVNAYFDPQSDYASYRTYRWEPAESPPTGDPRLDASPFFDSRIRSSVERELATKGLQQVASDSADLLVHYHVSIRDKVEVFSVDREYGYEFGPEDQVHEYEEGTLVLDIVDARSARVIWRGWVQTDVEGVVGNPQKMEQRIEKAVRLMLERLPAVSEAADIPDTAGSRAQ